jgi:glycosyltransferase involved in cell wall biosynthesis
VSGRLAPVAVVIPTYNAPVFLEDALRSVMRQTYGDFTCVVVDDGSTDDTPERVRELIAHDERFECIEQPNSGPGVARNRGVASSQSDILAFFDCDDVWDDRFLEVLVPALGEAPAAHCVTEGISADGSPHGSFAEWSRTRWQAEGSRLVRSPPGPTTFEALVTAQCIASPGAGIVRRSCFEKVGGYDPRIVLMEDWDLWIKLARLGPLTFVDEPLFFYRHHTSNRYVSGRTTRRDAYRVRRNAIAHPDNGAEQRRYAREASKCFYLDLGRSSLAARTAKQEALGLARLLYAYTF